MMMPLPILDILSGVKQGCVLALTLFGIFFATLLNMLLENPQKASTQTLGKLLPQTEMPGDTQ